jgi:DNA-binding transcriptional LysR family regulator
MVRFTLKQCAYFLAVAEHGGIAQAARARNISQPAVAQAIDKLELVTGLRLFDRQHARGTELTAQGRDFHSSARELLVRAERLQREAAAIAAELSGEIRLACFHTIAPFCVAKLVKGFRARYPDVQVAATEKRQDELVSGLESRAIDLAVTYEMALDPALLEWQVLARLRPRVILCEGHPLAGRASLRLEELAGEPFVLFDGPMSREYFLGVLQGSGKPPQIALRSSSMESVRSAVGNGLGFSLSVMQPRPAEAYDGGRVVSLPIADEVEPIRVVLARKRGRATTGLLASFSDHCRSFFADGL